MIPRQTAAILRCSEPVDWLRTAIHGRQPIENRVNDPRQFVGGEAMHHWLHRADIDIDTDHLVDQADRLVDLEPGDPVPNVGRRRVGPRRRGRRAAR